MKKYFHQRRKRYLKNLINNSPQNLRQKLCTPIIGINIFRIYIYKKNCQQAFIFKISRSILLLYFVDFQTKFFFFHPYPKLKSLIQYFIIKLSSWLNTYNIPNTFLILIVFLIQQNIKYLPLKLRIKKKYILAWIKQIQRI